MSLARSERAALADLLEQLGPDQPTLAEGWRTSDLLDHLLIREGRPDAAIGNVVPFGPLKAWSQKVARGLAQQPWPERVRALRNGPPAWNPLRLGKVDEIANSAEFFIHHEDARRGQPDWQPRTFDAATTAQLRAQLESTFVKLLARRSPVGLVADPGDGRPIVLKAGDPSATIAGAPGELLLWLSGRDAARVRVTGDPDAVTAVQGMERGM